MRLKIKLSDILEMVLLGWSERSIRKHGIREENVPKILNALERGKWSISDVG